MISRIRARTNRQGAGRLIASAIVLVGAAACVPEPTTALPREPVQTSTPVCNPGTKVTVSTVAAIQISWSPKCVVGGLGVITEDGRESMWAVGTTDGRATITGPVVYGQVPAGTTEGTAVRQLQSGVRYRVVLSGAGVGGVAPLLTAGSFVMP